MQKISVLARIAAECHYLAWEHTHVMVDQFRDAARQDPSLDFTRWAPARGFLRPEQASDTQRRFNATPMFCNDCETASRCGDVEHPREVQCPRCGAWDIELGRAAAGVAAAGRPGGSEGGAVDWWGQGGGSAAPGSAVGTAEHAGKNRWRDPQGQPARAPGTVVARPPMAAPVGPPPVAAPASTPPAAAEVRPPVPVGAARSPARPQRLPGPPTEDVDLAGLEAALANERKVESGNADIADLVRETLEVVPALEDEADFSPPGSGTRANPAATKTHRVSARSTPAAPARREGTAAPPPVSPAPAPAPLPQARPAAPHPPARPAARRAKPGIAPDRKVLSGVDDGEGSVVLQRAEARTAPGHETAVRRAVRRRPRPPNPEVGMIVGSTKLVRKIGAGTIGTVFQGASTESPRPVAIKILHPEYLENRSQLVKFSDQAREFTALSHPHIARVFEVGRDLGYVYVVTEWVEGSSLSHILEETGAFEIDEALELAGQIANGLAAAHARGQLHRDLKPQNVLVTPDEQVKLIDFGLIKNQSRLSKTGEVLGLPTYCAPEQLLSGATVLPQADLFALGACLYAMLAGVPPFPGRTPRDIIRLRLVVGVPDITDDLPHCPAPVAALLKTLLAERPQDRPETAAEVATQIETTFNAL